MARREAADLLEEAEIVSEGFVCWLGDDRIHYKTLAALIDHCLVSLDDSGGIFRRWTINETGHTVCRKPEMADQIWLELHVVRRQFTIENDKIVYLDKDVKPCEPSNPATE